MNRYWDDELRDARGRVIDTEKDMWDEETGNFVVTRNGAVPIGPKLAQFADPTKDTLVSVVWSKVEWKRHGFHTHICVQGTLQPKPDDDGSYRVLVSRAIYAYFDEKDVTAVMGRPNAPFKDGSHAVIYVE